MQDFDNMRAEDWKAMYLILFRGICDALELSGENDAVAERLIRAQQEAEDHYLDVPEGPVEG